MLENEERHVWACWKTKKTCLSMVENEKRHYVRFAYSGIDVADINEGLAKLKIYFES